MMNFYDLSPNSRSLFLGLIFTQLCFCLVLLSLSSRRKATISKLLLSVFAVADFFMLILFGADMRSSIYALERNVISHSFCEQPIIISIIVVVLILTALVVIGIKEILYRRNTITRSSIKESIDKLNAGLCFAIPNGRTILVNAAMNKLCYAITGTDLQNADSFWSRLSNNDIQNNIECLEKGENPCYRLTDGSVWRFSRENLDSFVQIIASNITQVYKVNNNLQDKNEELQTLNMRLREYGDNIDRLTRSKERLETKVNIHRELGQALLATRRYLQGASNESPVKIWEKNISVLRMESILPEEDSYKMFLDAAKSIGVEIKITGELPQNSEIRNLFMLAAAEALVNGVRHGNASTIFIDVYETDDYYNISFRNNGQQPDLPIKEGGGLGSLRKKVERLCGEMSVLTQPEFLLVIKINKKRF